MSAPEERVRESELTVSLVVVVVPRLYRLCFPFPPVVSLYSPLVFFTHSHGPAILPCCLP